MSTINAAPVTHSQSGPDYAAVKQRQQATWASGDFSVVAAPNSLSGRATL